jgi:predicted Zn-dependent protease
MHRNGQRVHVKRVVNVRLLVASTLIMVIVALAGWFWYLYQSKNVTKVLEQRAAALEKAEKWSEAAGYLSRYLQLEPNDVDGLLRLVHAVERTAETAPQRRRFIQLLYQTLGQLPTRDDLRLKLASQLLEVNQFKEAELEARKLVASQSGEHHSAAQRIIALSLRAQARPGGPVTIEEAAVELVEALAADPGDVTLATVTSQLFREYPQSVNIGDPATKADAIMDRLVEADPHDPEALIARYNYRHRYGINDARVDLETVLARDPNHVEALLLLSNEELSKPTDQSYPAAELKLRKIIEVQPTDPRGHIGLARLLISKDEQPKAIDVLSRGREKLKSPSMEVDALLAELLIGQNKIDDAARIIADFERELRRMLPEMTTAARIRFENVARLLTSRLHIARNETTQARRELGAIIASVAEADVTAGATERLPAHAMLAALMTKSGQFDLAAAQWKALADKAPDYAEARLRAGTAYLAMGRPVEAIAQLEPYLQMPSASAEAWIPLVQAHLQRQLQLAPAERNWSEFLLTLDQAKKKLPQRWELSLAEVDYWHALDSDDSKRQAVELLHHLEESHAEDNIVLAKLVTCYQQFKLPADADRALSLYDKCESSYARRVLTRTALLVQQGRSEEALTILASSLDKASDEERRVLQSARIRLLLETRQFDAAQKLVSEIIAKSPTDPAQLVRGLEVALTCQDFEAAARWENALKDLSLPDDFDWRFFRARRLLAQFASLDDQSRSELDSLIESLRSERPDWFPIITLYGQHEEICGNRSQAIDAYRLAIDLGDRRPYVFQRLVTALYAERRYGEANVYLGRLGVVDPADGRQESLAIATAINENGLQAALELAQQSVDRGSSNPAPYVWLANLLSLNGQHQEAEQVFNNAINRFPNDPGLWNALFGYLVRTKQPERARGVLDKLAEIVTTDAPEKHFILAQGFELLGDASAAQEHYRATIAGNSTNVEARLQLAKSLLSSDVAAARQQLEDILKINPENRQARRMVASLLAASGSESDWSRAIALLQTEQGLPATDDTIADDRLRAMLLSQRGRNRAERLANLEAARQILATRIGRPSGTAVDLDRMLLAGLCEQEAAMRDDASLVQAARDALLPLVDRDRPPPEYLVRYTRFLLRHLDRRDSANNSAELDEQQRTELLSDAQSRIEELEALLGEESTSESLFLPTMLRVQLLVAQDKSKEGLDLLNRFADEQLQAGKDHADRGRLLLKLADLASSCGFHREAEGWYRQLLTIAPNSYIALARALVNQNKLADAVEVCLRDASSRPPAEVATVLAQLLSISDIDAGLQERVQPIIASALQTNADNVELLISIAVRDVKLGDYDGAIKLFHRVLELKPNHTLALNNIATLLAERPNQMGDARKYVEQAIATAGRSPALLDTLGTILIRTGQHEEAVLALEEAVAGVAADPRYYFHLAVAYQRTGRENEAHEALETAHKYGLDKAILTSGDQELLASLKDKLLTTSLSD